ncbi:Heat shock protein HSP 90-beta [Phlyctochytrium bullatum]|nr:Heat shock protein HSP 90-beta [Phlyctochytrium bullatum]
MGAPWVWGHQGWDDMDQETMTRMQGMREEAWQKMQQQQQRGMQSAEGQQPESPRTAEGQQAEGQPKQVPIETAGEQQETIPTRSQETTGQGTTGGQETPTSTEQQTPPTGIQPKSTPAPPRLTAARPTPFLRGIPRIDVTETPTTYHIHADLPGIHKSDLSLTLKHDRILISGERRVEVSGGARHVVERGHGRFARTVRLPRDAVVEEVEARLDHGVLEIVVAKRRGGEGMGEEEGEGEARRITIQ